MALLKTAYKHLVAIQERLCTVPSDMYISWLGVQWMLKYAEQDWPWSTMALKPSPKLSQNGKMMAEKTTPGEMYAMLNYKLPDRWEKFFDLMWKGKPVTEMRLCVSYDDVRRDRAGNEPSYFFVTPRYFEDYMDLNNCKTLSHCLLLPIESPEERLKLVSDKEWFNSFQKLKKFDGVEVLHDDAWHPARLRYEGSVAIWDRPDGPEGVMQWDGDEVDGGTFFGVELLRGSVGKGNTDGVHYGQERTGALTEKENGHADRRFTCEPNCGLFVDASKIRAKPDLLTEEEKKVGVEIGLREEGEKCREGKVQNEQWKRDTEGKTFEEMKAMKRLVTTEYGKTVNIKPDAEGVDEMISKFVYNEKTLHMFRDFQSWQTEDEAEIAARGDGDDKDRDSDSDSDSDSVEEEKEPDISIDEFRAIRKQFHERQNAKIKKYYQNLARESDDDNDDDGSQGSRLVCAKCNEIREEKTL